MCGTTVSQSPLGLLCVPLGHLAIVTDVGIIIENTRVITRKQINITVTVPKNNDLTDINKIEIMHSIHKVLET